MKQFIAPTQLSYIYLFTFLVSVYLLLNNRCLCATKTWWQPSKQACWNYQIGKNFERGDDISGVGVYNVDLFENSPDKISAMKAKGLRVICYINAGAWEDWRPDASNFTDSVKGKKYPGWRGEKFLDVTNYQKFAGIMQARMDMAVQKNCDGLEFDNVDVYNADNTGFTISDSDQIKYNIWLASQAHNRNLSAGLKNDFLQVGALVNYFDFMVVESAIAENHLEACTNFTDQGKAVFGVEYKRSLFPKTCYKPESLGFAWVFKDLELKQSPTHYCKCRNSTRVFAGGYTNQDNDKSDQANNADSNMNGSTIIANTDQSSGGMNKFHLGILVITLTSLWITSL